MLHVATLWVGLVLPQCAWSPGSTSVQQPHASSTLAVCPVPVGRSGSNFILMAATSDGGNDVEQQLPAVQQPKRMRRWRKRAKSASVGLATAALLAMPRGPARAAELQQRPVPTPVSRDAERGGEPPLAFLGMSRKKTIVYPFERTEATSDQIDMDKLLGKKATRKYTERSFLFSEELTAKTPLEDELEQLDEVKSEKGFAKTIGTAVTYGTALGGVYLTVRGMSNVERWMKQQELRDIEEERELTGQYISVDASDVDTSIDPTTGKNLTIVKKAAKPNATATDAADAEPEQVPWILRVLGLGGAAAADADDFWEAPAATVRRDGTIDSDASDDGADGGDGSEGADPADPSSPESGGGDGGTEDDEEGLDTLDDLLG